MPAESLLLGDRFPSLDVTTTHGPMRLPNAYAGRWFVLFSHPGDFTPVCTTEFMAFQTRLGIFEELKCSLIGLSVDQVFSHLKWIEWIRDHLNVEIEFPIIADEMGLVAQRLGLIHPGKGTNTVRAVYIVDPDALIRATLYYPQELGRNMEEIIRMVRGLQVADANGVALPANWPHNELIKDGLIVPPPADEQTAKERLKQYEGFDWWFCHTELR